VPNPIVHFEIAGEDPAKLQSFYRDLFDWTIDANNPMSYGFAKTGEGSLSGGILQGHGPMTHYLTLYIQVPDLDAHLKKIEAHGGRTVLSPTNIPNGGTFALFADPAGNVVGMFKG
jgi:predicted enzyme related to lactoylglutathione lyase